MKLCKFFIGLIILLTASLSFAAGLPTHAQLQAALKTIVAEQNGGFGLNMWATIVDRDGVVKAVVFSGKDRGDQWPGSRVFPLKKRILPTHLVCPNCLYQLRIYIQPFNRVEASTVFNLVIL